MLTRDFYAAAQIHVGKSNRNLSICVNAEGGLIRRNSSAPEHRRECISDLPMHRGWGEQSCAGSGLNQSGLARLVCTHRQ